MKTIDFWFEFASTYSYLSAMRIEDAAAGAGIDVNWRPFLLGPIFHKQGWDNSPFNIYPTKGAYMWRDMERQAAEMSIGFQQPEMFPQNGLVAARIVLVGDRAAWVPEFVRRVYMAEFADGALISEGALLRGILSSLTSQADDIFELASGDEAKAALRSNTEAAEAAGIFGAPSFTTEDGELFWGNDRLEAALSWVVRRPQPA